MNPKHYLNIYPPKVTNLPSGHPNFLLATEQGTRIDTVDDAFFLENPQAHPENSDCWERPFNFVEPPYINRPAARPRGGATHHHSYPPMTFTVPGLFCGSKGHGTRGPSIFYASSIDLLTGRVTLGACFYHAVSQRKHKCEHRHTVVNLRPDILVRLKSSTSNPPNALGGQVPVCQVNIGVPFTTGVSTFLGSAIGYHGAAWDGLPLYGYTGPAYSPASHISTPSDVSRGLGLSSSTPRSSHSHRTRHAPYPQTPIKSRLQGSTIHPSVQNSRPPRPPHAAEPSCSPSDHLPQDSEQSSRRPINYQQRLDEHAALKEDNTKLQKDVERLTAEAENHRREIERLLEFKKTLIDENSNLREEVWALQVEKEDLQLRPNQDGYNGIHKFEAGTPMETQVELLQRWLLQTREQHRNCGSGADYRKWRREEKHKREVVEANLSEVQSEIDDLQITMEEAGKGQGARARLLGAIAHITKEKRNLEHDLMAAQNQLAKARAPRYQ